MFTGIWWEALWIFNWKESRIVGRHSLSSQASYSEGKEVQSVFLGALIGLTQCMWAGCLSLALPLSKLP